MSFHTIPCNYKYHETIKAASNKVNNDVVAEKLLLGIAHDHPGVLVRVNGEAVVPVVALALFLPLLVLVLFCPPARGHHRVVPETHVLPIPIPIKQEVPVVWAVTVWAAAAPTLVNLPNQVSHDLHHQLALKVQALPPCTGNHGLTLLLGHASSLEQ